MCDCTFLGVPEEGCPYCTWHIENNTLPIQPPRDPRDRDITNYITQHQRSRANGS